MSSSASSRQSVSHGVGVVCCQRCPCQERRRLEHRLPFKRTAVLVAYLCSMVIGMLGAIMLACSVYLEDRSDFTSALAAMGVNSKCLAVALLGVSALTPFVDKAQQFWVELELNSKKKAYLHQHATMFNHLHHGAPATIFHKNDLVDKP